MGTASKVPSDPAMSSEVRSFLDELSRNFDSLVPADGAAGLVQTDFISGVILAPTAKDFRIIEKIPYPIIVTAFTTKTASGTLTATLKINTTAITTGAASVTSTQGTVVPTALNSMAAGDTLL